MGIPHLRKGWKLRRLLSPQRLRLDEAIQVARHSLEVRLAVADPEAVRPALEQAKLCLDEAREAANRREIDTGWALVHRARELEIHAFNHWELTGAARELAIEAAGSHKLTPWRRAAVLEATRALSRRNKDGSFAHDLAERRCWLERATRIRNEASSGEYRGITLVQTQQVILVVIGMVVVVLTLALLASKSGDFDDAGELGQWWVVVAAGLVGALGAVTSALERSTRVTSSVRTQERIGLLGAALLRPFIGLVAGLSAYLTARTLSPEEHQVAVALLASFGAGFTERLLMRGEGFGGQREAQQRSGIARHAGEDAELTGGDAAAPEVDGGFAFPAGRPPKQPAVRDFPHPGGPVIVLEEAPVDEQRLQSTE